ncbi:MAG: cell division ATP-binding protein FtsE [Planctomycetes bacterium]|nr:cell division ATP-binding protein FtsE [Planctomycetota bacterium]
MIAIQSLSKLYDNDYHGLNDVSLAIDQGEFVFLVGPSGSGKTTLFNVLHGRERPSSGRVQVLAYELTRLRADQLPVLRRDVGMIFQDYKLLPKRTVYENIAFVLQVLHYKRRRIHQLVHQVLDLVGLTNKAHDYPRALSGGEQQRICIARAIVHQPRILLADEPTGNLDPDTAWDIMQLLGKINQRKTTIIVATHDWRIVNKMRRRVVRLMNGNVVSDTIMGHYA